MADDITLRVDGLIYGGWKRASVTRSIEQMAGTFALDVTDRWEEDSPARPIQPGQPCSVEVGAAAIIVGFVDDAAVRYDGESRQISIQGRDRAADLVDCSALHDPDEWNGQTLTRLVEILAAPFSIRVRADVPVGQPFGTFKLQPGETAFSAIERLCRARGVLPVSDGRGGLLLTRAGSRRAAAPLELGRDGNVMSAEGSFSKRDRHSLYVVRGSSQGSDQAWGPQLAAEGTARDAAVGRYRPLVIVAETQVDTGTAEARAAWEASTRAGRGVRSTYTVQGWSVGGRLWQPNSLTRVRDSILAIDQDMLIVGVRYELSEEAGTRTALTVVHPDAYKLIPLPEETEEPGW